MDEASIAEQQKQNIPKPEEHTPAPITAPELTGFGTAAISLDEMTQYKLHDVFGEQYRPNDEVNRQRLQYIYEKVSQDMPEKDYAYVAAKIRETMRIAGITHSDNRIYKTYQWLKLNNIIRQTSAEMESLRG